MKPIYRIMLAFILLLALLSLAYLARAQLDGYTLNWWTVDGGGGSSSGGGYTLNGTLGQPDAAPVASGGGYSLAGGFWHGGVAAPAQTKVYLPLTTKP
jgi:hypothetical protein